MSDGQEDGPTEIILTQDEPIEITQPEAEAPEAPEAETGEEGERTEDGSDKEPLRDEKGKFKRNADGQIERLTYLRRQAERERDEAIAQLNGARKSGEPPADKPIPDKFADYGDYVEALTDWKADQRDAKRSESEASRSAQRADQLRGQEWQSKVAATSATIPDYADVVGKSELPVAGHVAEALMDADRGPELAYHLAQNPETVDRLNDMSPARAAIELGKIEATLGATPAKATTKAPAPITPVRSGSSTTKDPAKMDMAEYTAYRAKMGIR